MSLSPEISTIEGADTFRTVEGSSIRAEMAWLDGPSGVKEQGTCTEGPPGTWEAPSSPIQQYRHERGAGYKLPQICTPILSGRCVAKIPDKGSVPPSEGNEVRRDGRRGVGAAHSTADAGEPVPWDPVEGRGSRITEPSEGKMTNTSGLEGVSTKRRRIAELARKAPEMVLTTLAHHIDMYWLHEAYRLTRKDGASGVDGLSANEYAENLEENLRSLLERAKSGTYHAPPVRRVHIPKGRGSETRPLGIPTFEDKVLQRAVTMVLESVYEEDFYNFSFGFRPGRSAHQALKHLWDGAMSINGGWVIDVDIRRFFDTLNRKCLREILSERVRDGVLLRLVGKWLNAGVLEDGSLTQPKTGTPQGGVISPLLANIYLHTVFDRWYAEDVAPLLKGRAVVVRYADDLVLIFEEEEDARRMMRTLPKRFARFGLALHPEKTRLVPFRRPRHRDRGKDLNKRGEPGSFDFLGFTHHWGRSRRGFWVVKQKTAKARLARTISSIDDWCRRYRHEPIVEQHRALEQRLRGHYAYFGLTGNSRSLQNVFQAVRRSWRKWLGRRSGKAKRSWEWYMNLSGYYPLPPPRVVHSVTCNAAKP